MIVRGLYPGIDMLANGYNFVSDAQVLTHKLEQYWGEIGLQQRLELGV